LCYQLIFQLLFISECIIPLHSDDFLEVMLHKENNAGIFIKGISTRERCIMSKEQLLVARTKLLRQQYPPSLRLLPGMEYNKRLNLVTNLNSLPLLLNQRVLLESKRKKRKGSTEQQQMRKENKVVNNIHYPNLRATSSRGCKAERRNDAETKLHLAFP
jgi:hypothetical protein